MSDIDQTIHVQIRFTAQTAYGEFADALYYPLADYISGLITPERVAADQQSRVDNWIAAITTPVDDAVTPDTETAGE